ncbi:MAG TPA: DUF58 domain-containing protein, partial [bacterium]|nr:DUF58 domain-containing protein [bacterium]
LTGFNIEFAEYQQFNDYEDTKFIDWKLYAKTEKLFVKKYEEDNALNISILLDSSNSMSFQSSYSLNKLEYSKFICACIIYKTIKQNDCFELKTFNSELQTIINFTNNPIILKQTDNELKKIEASSQTKYGKIFSEYMTNLKKRQMIIIISDFLFDDDNEFENALKIIRQLSKNGNSILFIHILDDFEINFDFPNTAIEFRGLETNNKITIIPEKIKNKYISIMNEYLKMIYNECSNSGIYYTLMNTNIPLEKNIQKIFKS